mgnify:CR=1 FL=1
MSAIAIGGTCKPGFERVAEAFSRNFEANGEVGASVCLTVGGDTVVDLWGGVADPKTGAAWQQDTVSIVFSCTKGATALCAHILASRGQLDLDAKGYLNAYQDVAKANVDPLLHYDLYGYKEGRDPSTSFDTAAYLAANPGVASAGANPMVHYLMFGAVEGRSTVGDTTFGFGSQG